MKCPECKAEDVEYDCGFWKCNYCGNIWENKKEKEEVKN